VVRSPLNQLVLALGALTLGACAEDRTPTQPESGAGEEQGGPAQAARHGANEGAPALQLRSAAADARRQRPGLDLHREPGARPHIARDGAAGPRPSGHNPPSRGGRGVSGGAAQRGARGASHRAPTPRFVTAIVTAGG